MTRTQADANPNDLTRSHVVSGRPFRTLGRTLTEADTVNFAGVTGDWKTRHCNAEWAARHAVFGERVAHGLLVITAATTSIQQEFPPAANIVDAKADVVGTVEVVGEIALRCQLRFSTEHPVRALAPARFSKAGVPTKADVVSFSALSAAWKLQGRPWPNRGQSRSTWLVQPLLVTSIDAAQLPLGVGADVSPHAERGQ